MFELTEETKANAVQAIKDVFARHGHGDVPDDAILYEAIDAAVKVVKEQFGF